MKKIIIITIALLGLASLALAQSPEKINFQTVIRDNGGIPMANQSLDIRFSIAYGLKQPYKTAYQEIFKGLTTDDFGVLHVHIGTGTPDLNNYGPFSDIAWGQLPIFLHIEIDLGKGYLSLGATEMVSVPHAMFSDLADSVAKVRMSQLDDVNLKGVSDEKILKYNQKLGKWFPGTVRMRELEDVNIKGIKDGEILKYNQNSGKWFPGVDGTSLWSANGNKIYYTTGNVGIGTSNPIVGLTLGTSSVLAFEGDYYGPLQRDLLSLFGTYAFESDSFVGFGYETKKRLNVQNQQVYDRILYNKSQGGYNWYIGEKANGGGNASMVLSRAGYLGIGVDNPISVLNIDNQKHIANSTPYGSFAIGDPSSLVLAMDYDEIQVYGVNASPATLSLQRTGGNIRLCDGSGNVGIEAPNPKARLHIQIGNDAEGGSNTNNGYLMLGSLSAKNIIMDDNEIMARNGASDARLFLQSDGGKASVGDISKGHILFDDGKIQGMYNNNEGPLFLQNAGGDILACNDDNGQIGIGLGSLSADAKVNIQDDRWQLRLDNPDLGGGQWFIGASANNWATSGGELIFGTSTNEASGVLVLNGINNSVGIGTSDIPANAKLAVDGAIICEELRVRMSNLWPDYVFSDTYQLRSLEALEAHIEENHHLPGIPAAAEIEADGIPVGEMQKMMMEKIEELTLYVIDQNKQLKDQQARIKQLEAELGNR